MYGCGLSECGEGAGAGETKGAGKLRGEKKQGAGKLRVNEARVRGNCGEMKRGRGEIAGKWSTGAGKLRGKRSEGAGQKQLADRVFGSCFLKLADFALKSLRRRDGAL